MARVINRKDPNYHAKWYQKHKERTYWRWVKRQYNLTQEAFTQLLEQQEFSCKLCETTFEGKPHIDHCHETNVVRGLLCLKCNVGLGMLGDNEQGLLRALAYVKGEL